MEKGHTVTKDTAHSDEISLLDLLVVIAESWWIIIAGSSLVGLAIYVSASNQVPTYFSTAVLSASPAMIEPMLASNPDFVESRIGFTIEASPSRPPATRPTAIPVPIEDTIVTYRAQYADIAEANLLAFIDSVTEQIVAYEQSPLKVRVALLDQRLIDIGTLFQQAEMALAQWQIEQEADQSAVASMLLLKHQLQQERFTLEEEARTLSEQMALRPQTILVAPPSPAQRDTVRSPILLATAAAISTGFILLLVAFLRHGLRQCAANPENSAKLQRIKNALIMRTPRKSRNINEV